MPQRQRHAGGYGLTMARVFGFGPIGRITFGATTSCIAPHPRRAQLRMLTIVDEFTREAFGHQGRQAVEQLGCHRDTDGRDLTQASRTISAPTTGPRSQPCGFATGCPRRRAKTLYIEPGSPWENGYIEILNGKLRDELLKGEIFDSLMEARVMIDLGDGSTTRTGRTGHWAIGPQPRLLLAVSTSPPSNSSRCSKLNLPHKPWTGKSVTSRLAVVDGIKYQRLGDEHFYAQEAVRARGLRAT